MSTLIPAAQFAAAIEHSPRWVLDHIHTGEIPAIKIGASYFITDELIAEMSRRAIQPSHIPSPEPQPMFDQVGRGGKKAS